MSGQFCTLAMFVHILASFALFKMFVYWPEGIGKSYQHTPPKRPQQNKRDGGSVFRIILLFCFKPLLQCDLMFQNQRYLNLFLESTHFHQIPAGLVSGRR